MVKQREFEIVLSLSDEYSVSSLCKVMNISKSGFYKWKNNKDKLNRWELNRLNLSKEIVKYHNQNPSYGYHRITYMIKKDTGWMISDNLVHKVCKILKIYSKAKHYRHVKKEDKEEHKTYPNLIQNDWSTKRPFEKVVSDGTMIRFKGIPYDWNYYVDIFDNSIVGSDVSNYNHCVDTGNHTRALKNMLKNKIKRGYKDQETIFHSDQGSIYTSASFNDVYKDYNIIRSMSRAGTPTDNPYIESKNGWLKMEMKLDFDEDGFDTVQEFIDYIIYYHNNLRPSYSLNYKTPVQYRTELGFN